MPRAVRRLRAEAEDAGVEEFEDSEGSSDFSDSEGSASEPDAHDAFFPSEKGSQPTPISRQFARKLASAGDTHNRRPRSAGDADRECGFDRLLERRAFAWLTVVCVV